MTKSLAGVSILVTRPAHQAGELAERIRTAGGIPILFPVLEILDITDRRPLLNLIARLDEFDLAIFISPNAVDKAAPLIQARGMPPGLRLAAVGKSTAGALRKYGMGDKVIAPSTRFDSEALLETAELKGAEGKQVVIFRGDEGRELLGRTLTERGAKVEYAVCYRRVKPSCDITPLLDALANRELNAVIVTSSEGAHNLLDMAGKMAQALLLAIPLFVSHERIARTAEKLGWTHVILTPPGDDGLLEGLLNYFGSKVAVSAKS